MTEYYVRPSFQLHRQVEQMVKGKKIKGTKLYQEGDLVEKLTEEETIQYQHLIE